MLSKENNMKQDRYVIFTSDELGLETYLGSGSEAKRVDLGNTPEAIAESMKTLGISSNDDISIVYKLIPRLRFIFSEISPK